MVTDHTFELFGQIQETLMVAVNHRGPPATSRPPTNRPPLPQNNKTMTADISYCTTPRRQLHTKIISCYYRIITDPIITPFLARKKSR